MEKTVVALFDSLDTAQTAVQQLIDSGFSRDDISVVRTNQQGDYTSGNMVEGSDHDASGAAAGAGIGAVLGGLAGLLVGLGALAIPGIGPIIAAGPLATTLAGAGLGAATGGLVGALADTGIPESDAGAYAEGVRRGGTLVTVRAGEAQVNSGHRNSQPVQPRSTSTSGRASGARRAGSGYDSERRPLQHRERGAAHAPGCRDDREQPDYRASTGLTGENSGGSPEGAGSLGYTARARPTRAPAASRATPSRRASGENIGSTTWNDEDSVMRSGHGEMSTSQGFSGQGGGTYERMQEQDPTVHPRSSEGDYQARRDFLGGPETEGDFRDTSGAAAA